MPEQMIQESPNRNPWIPEPYTINIELADGRIINGSGGLDGAEESLLLWTDAGTFDTLSEVIGVFDNPDLTSHIKIHYSRIEQKEFVGFTDLRSAQIKTNGAADIRLYK